MEYTTKGKWQRWLDKAGHMGMATKKKHPITIVGAGLAGLSGALSLADKGFPVNLIFPGDSPLRSHSAAAQGGINAPLNLNGDGDSQDRLFVDDIKGGDFLSREDEVRRLVEIAEPIIRNFVASGLPFARKLDGTIDVRSFGGVHNIERTLYSGTEIGKNLLHSTYYAIQKYIKNGQIKLYPYCHAIRIATVKGVARGVILKRLIDGKVFALNSSAVVIATGGYSRVYHYSTNATSSNGAVAMLCHEVGAGFADPSLIQIHPTGTAPEGDFFKMGLVTEAVRQDEHGRVWVPKDKNESREANMVPKQDRDYLLENVFPNSGNLPPRDKASREIYHVLEEGRGVGSGKRSVYLDLTQAVQELGVDKIKELYGPVLDLYEKMTGVNPYEQPMLISPAPHYSMGGVETDYELMTNISGLFVTGEANSSIHGANRLGANGLLHVLVDGMGIIGHTVENYLYKVHNSMKTVDLGTQVVVEKIGLDYLSMKRGTKPVSYFRQTLGEILWKSVGIIRNANGLNTGLVDLAELSDEFYRDVAIQQSSIYNRSLQNAFEFSKHLDLALIMLMDASERQESRGAHFRSDFPNRDDGIGQARQIWTRSLTGLKMQREKLEFHEVEVAKRSY